MAVLSSSTSYPKYAAREPPRGNYDGPMVTVKRIAAGIGLFLGGLAYVWYAGVRAVPAVKRRKAALRAESDRRQR